MYLMNIMLLMISVYCLAAAHAVKSSKTGDGFDLGIAKIAVREELNTIPSLENKMMSVTNSCSQLDGDGGTVMGQARSSKTLAIIQGVPMSESTEFSYEAKVKAHCSKVNLNCYAVERLELQGMKAFYPQI